MTDIEPQENTCIFLCIKCAFKTQYKRDYNKHLSTAKHNRLTLTLTNTDVKDQKPQKDPSVSVKKYECLCGKTYMQRQSLFTHKKKCIFLQKEFLEEKTIPIDSTKIVVNSSIILDILKENQEFKNLLIEQSVFHQKQVIELQKENNILMNKMVEISHTAITTPPIINNNNNTINNNQFNLNIFLNETCKNAINFSDFIDNIQVTDDDLENNVKMGFVDGMTKVIVEHLKQLALIDRPIHCTDVKRETIYVKVEEQWDKDNSTKVIQKGIQNITCKNMQQLVDWRENNPSYADDMDSELGEKSIAMQQNSLAGTKRDDYYPKIIKNIAKETVLDKKRMLE